jgi:hypothetical protein
VTTKQRIAVIGAGIAGLSAARRLATAHSQPMVFDKARRPGGRVSTRRTHEFAFDHGAQYFTCRAPAFESLVSDWCLRGVAARWEAPIITLANGVRGGARGEPARYVGVPGMSALARDLAADFDVACEERIARIARSSGRWSVISDAGRVFDGFDAVVIATPAPQATPLLAVVPEFAARVAAVQMQACHVAMLVFAEPFGVDFGGAFVAESPLAWVARNGTKPGRASGECWVLQTTPEWSTAHLEQSPEAVTAELLDALGAALGCALPPTILRASHRWLFARSDRPLGHPFLWDPDVGLGVCGDWTLGGRVENAFLSGDQLGIAMLGE